MFYNKTVRAWTRWNIEKTSNACTLVLFQFKYLSQTVEPERFMNFFAYQSTIPFPNYRQMLVCADKNMCFTGMETALWLGMMLLLHSLWKPVTKHIFYYTKRSRLWLISSCNCMVWTVLLTSAYGSEWISYRFLLILHCKKFICHFKVIFKLLCFTA